MDNLDINTLEGWNNQAERQMIRHLTERGIEPTPEAISNGYDDINKACKELQLKAEQEQVKTMAEEITALKRELANKKDLIGTLERSIDKIGFMLDEFTQDYGFAEKPDPSSALNYIRNMSTDSPDIHGKQSFTWFWEYNRIFNLVDVSIDYVIMAHQALKLEEE